MDKYYHFNKEDADRAVAYYRENYEKEAIYRSPLYDGVREMLQDLQAMGKKLFVVTAKPQELAGIVLRHTGIAGYFQAVIGPDRSERKTDKAALSRRALWAAEESEEKAAGAEKDEAAGTNAVGTKPAEAAEGNADQVKTAEHSLMVGDRHYDIEGAMQTGLDSMGVLYGYGSRRELSRAGAAYLARTPAEVVELLR